MARFVKATFGWVWHDLVGPGTACSGVATQGYLPCTHKNMWFGMAGHDVVGLVPVWQGKAWQGKVFTTKKGGRSWKK